MHEYNIHGKWILAGEHSVIRGTQALVFPVGSRSLHLRWQSSEQPLGLSLPQGQGDLELAFWGVLEKALQQVCKQRSDLKGVLYCESNIPIGAGMGASATLCVAIARWFSDLGFLNPSQLFEFSKSLEDLFHGQSSGVDVAVALSNEGILYKRGEAIQPFKPSWRPYFYLSHSGKRGITADCIRKVQSFMQKYPEQGQRVDDKMQSAVTTACEALSGSQNLPLLAQSLRLARECFEEWDLVSKELGSTMWALKESGAIETKPTGSGEGGFVLSLWEEEPSEALCEKLGLIQA